MGAVKSGTYALRCKRYPGNMPVYITEEANNILRLQFQYDLWLKDEIRAMEGSRWDKDRKTWVIANSARNAFALQYLSSNGINPYARYDKPVDPVPAKRRKQVTGEEFDIQQHQLQMIAETLERKRVLLAAEQGTGKTLVTIEVMERVKPIWPVYIAPKGALEAVRSQFRVWNAHVIPEFMSYDTMKTLVNKWKPGKLAPDLVVMDEAHQVKTVSSQRSQAAKGLADGMRCDHQDPFIILMTGTPAPKDPLDYWMPCEIVCPGFIREGSPSQLKYRLAVIQKKPSMSGGTYPELITWRDDPRKCHVCGQTYEHVNHTSMALEPHTFVPSKNEIEGLYRRLKGLVYICFKKDCTDLPDKIYRTVHCTPSESILRAMRLIARKSPTVIEALSLTRELSDGFQYAMETSSSFDKCPICAGNGRSKQVVVEDDIPPWEDVPERNVSADLQETMCPKCEGTGQVPAQVRVAKEIPCPKEDALSELLEENEETGRLVVYAGFTASVDRIVKFCMQKKWDVIRQDGRGVWTSFPLGDTTICKICGEKEGHGLHNPANPQFHSFSPPSALEIFQDSSKKIPRIVFVGQPAAAGVSLTLTAANMIVYYSNTFNGVDRFQSEDRIHRIGMDVNKGAIIVDLLHLPTDAYVLENIRKKKVLQAMTLGDLQAYIDQNQGETNDL